MPGGRHCAGLGYRYQESIYRGLCFVAQEFCGRRSGCAAKSVHTSRDSIIRPRRAIDLADRSRPISKGPSRPPTQIERNPVGAMERKQSLRWKDGAYKDPVFTVSDAIDSPGCDRTVDRTLKGEPETRK